MDGQSVVVIGSLRSMTNLSSTTVGIALSVSVKVSPSTISYDSNS